MIGTNFHARSLTAPSLQPAVAFVKRCTAFPFTPFELLNAAKCTNPTGVISELRKNGFTFEKTKSRVNGKLVSHYITTGVPV